MSIISNLINPKEPGGVAEARAEDAKLAAQQAKQEKFEKEERAAEMARDRDEKFKRRTNQRGSFSLLGTGTTGAGTGGLATTPTVLGARP